MNKSFVCLLSVGIAASACAVKFDPDLTKMDENREAIRKALADPKTGPADRLWAKYYDLKWDLYTCEDGDFPAKKAEVLKLITERGDNEKKPYLDFIYGVVNDNQGVIKMPDIWPIADRETKDEPTLRYGYYSHRISAMQRASQRLGTVDPTVCAEARLKLIEQMEKDPMVDERHRDGSEQRFACLVEMGCHADAEKLLLERAASTNSAQRLIWLSLAADFYKDRAVRYYTEPDPATLRKVVKVCDDLIATDLAGRPSRYSRKGYLMKADALYHVGEFAEARKAVDGYVALLKDAKCDFDAAKLYADIAFAEKKWGEVTERLSPFVEKLDADWNIKCAQSLVAAGRRREALPYLEAASKKCRNKYKRDGYGYLLQKFKSEFGEAN